MADFSENQILAAKIAAVRSLDPFYARVISKRRDLTNGLLGLKIQMPAHWQSEISKLAKDPYLLPEVFNAAHDLNSAKSNFCSFVRRFIKNSDQLSYLIKWSASKEEFFDDRVPFASELFFHALEIFAKELGIMNQVREKVRELQQATSQTQQPQPSAA